MESESSPEKREFGSIDHDDLVKPFTCDFPGCTKSFTRSENLSRHKLNHQPKKIYRCSKEGCRKTFVRYDLLKRHENSHRDDEQKGRRKKARIEEERSLGRSSSDDSAQDQATSTTRQDSIDDLLQNLYQSPSQVPSSSGDGDVPFDVHDLNQMRLSSSMMVPFGTTPSDIPSSVVVPESYLTSFEGAMSDDFTSWLLSETAFDAQPNKPKSFTSAKHPLLPEPQCKVVLGEPRRLELLQFLSPDAKSLPELQLKMCNNYISEYFDTFHPQMPIIHMPTFDPNTAPAPLTLAILAYGSYHKDSSLSQTMIQNLRWVVFSSPDFEPPVQVWVIQALLLIEVFEKTMASRNLHALAHIFHATTLTLLKRGNYFYEVKRINNGDENVLTESIKRVVFAAFLLDASHAAIFGHSLILSVDELRLNLPCDDSLWDDKAIMKEQPLGFLVALKRALNRSPVNTNTFGRFIIIHGMLSVTWHMRQRERQNSNGVGLGDFKSDWRVQISRALEAWISHYDKYIQATSTTNILDDYRHCMYHHSCILLSASLIDVQVYAGAKYITGRAVSESDILRIETYMQQWAVTVNARWAVVHAARLLREVLVDGWMAKNDPIMMRPWGVYHATLVIWSYGFAMSHQPGNEYLLEQPTDLSLAFEHSQPSDREEMSAQWYIESVSKVADADEIVSIRGLSRTLGVLLKVRGCVANCWWELRNLL